MEDFKSWPPNIGNHNPSLLPESPSLSSSSNATSQEETRSTTTLQCEDHSSSSFSSLDSNIITNHPCIIDNNNVPSLIPSVTISHLRTIFVETTTPQISCLAVKDDALYAATVKEISVFDLRTLSIIGTFGTGSGLAKSIAFSGDRIFTAHQDRKIRVWEKVVTSTSGKPRHKLISTLPTCRDRVSNCFLPKNYVRIRRHVRRLWIEHVDAVSGLAALGEHDDGLMYSVSWDKCFKIWKVHPSGARCLESIEAHSDAVNAVAVCPSDRTVYTGSADGEIKIWTSSGDTKRKHTLVATLREHESSVNAMALTGKGPGFCSGGGDGVILIWERDDENNVKRDFYVGGCLRGHQGAVLCLVHVNGLLISGSSDRSVRVWGFGNGFGGCLGILEGHCKPVKSLVVIPQDDDDNSDGSAVSVFSGSMDGEIRAWKVSVSDQFI